MIQIYWADEKDFIRAWSDFKDDNIEGVLRYIKEGLLENENKIIKIRRYENKAKK